MNKIETESVYTESQPDKLSGFQTISRHTSKISKLKTDKKIPQPAPFSAE